MLLITSSSERLFTICSSISLKLSLPNTMAISCRWSRREYFFGKRFSLKKRSFKRIVDLVVVRVEEEKGEGDTFLLLVVVKNTDAPYL